MTWENMIYYFVGNQLRRNDNILLCGNFKGMIISIKNIGISLRFSVLMEVSPLLTAFHFSRLMWRPSSQWRKQKMQFKECYWWPTSAIPWKSKVVRGAGFLLLPNIQIAPLSTPPGPRLIRLADATWWLPFPFYLTN